MAKGRIHSCFSLVCFVILDGMQGEQPMWASTSPHTMLPVNPLIMLCPFPSQNLCLHVLLSEIFPHFFTWSAPLCLSFSSHQRELPWPPNQNDLHIPPPLLVTLYLITLFLFFNLAPSTIWKLLVLFFVYVFITRVLSLEHKLYESRQGQPCFSWTLQCLAHRRCSKHVFKGFINE